MPLLPIDLQIMFSHMNRVGREQSVQRQIVPAAQAFQASELVKETEQRDNSVNESREVGEGLEKVKEEEEKRERRKSSRERERRGEGKQSETEKKIFRDPYLGQNVDIIR